MTLAERLKQARDAESLSQRGLAELAGLSNAYVHILESGSIKQPSAGKLKRLADALGVRPEWLAYGTGDMRGPVNDDTREAV